MLPHRFLFPTALLCLLAAPASAQTGLQTNGSSQYVTFGAAPALGAPTFTLELWFRREGAGATTSTGTGGHAAAIPLVAKGRGEADGDTRDMNYFLGIRAADGVLVADYEEGTGQTQPGLNHPIAGVTPIQTGVWYHAAASFDGRNWRLFLNGVLEKDTLMSAGRLPQSASIQHASLGSALTSTGAVAGYFFGTLDEVRIWDHARPGAGIGDSLGLEIPTAPGLIGRWALDAISGTSTANTVAGSPAGTVVGGATTVTGAPFAITPAQPPNPPAAPAPADLATGVSTAPDVSVAVSDPDGGNLSVTFYGRPVGAGGSPGADFTLIGLPDTQYYTSSMNGGSPAIFDAQTNWIVANKALRNIIGVIQLGDCVQNGDNGGNAAEWLNADRSMKTLENPATTLLADGIPFGVCVGNHDQSPIGSADGTTAFYNQYFGTSRFLGRGYYGGHYGSNNDNHYELFSASGLDFIVVSLEYDTTPDAAVLAWADNLLTTYANRRAIVASHYIINDGNPATFGTQGQAIYNALKGHSNLFLMLSGHVSPPEGRRSDTASGHTIYSVMSDYQDRTHGGDGWLRIYEFSPANSVIRVRTYSPWLGQFETDADSSSQFTLPYDMGGAGPYQVIATRAGVTSGSTVAATWAGLAANRAYEWYAAVGDGVRTTTGPTWRFTTGSASTNLVANGGFESNTTGWTRYGGATLSRASEGHSGTRSLQAKGATNSTAVFGCDDSPNWVGSVAGVGAVYRFSAWVKTPASSKGKARLRVYEYLGATQQGATTYSPDVALGAGWQLLTVDYAVRTAGTALSLRVTDTPAAAGETMLVDDVSITLLSSAATVAAAAPPVAPAGSEADADTESGLEFAARFSPNPARGRATLEYTLTRSSQVNVELFDTTGRRVRGLIAEAWLPAGHHAVQLDPRDAAGERLRAGVYFSRIEAGEGVLGGRVILIE